MILDLKFGLLGLLGAAAVNAAPAPTRASEIEQRSSTCTFSGSKGAASAIKAKTSCSTITLSSLEVPAGTTLDLTGLKKGTTVSYLTRSGTTAESSTNLVNRLSLKARPPSATRSGLVLWSQSPELTSLSREPPVLSSTVTVPAGGMERELTAARPSPSSSTPTR